MAKFTDTITIRVKAGNGGPGSVSFMREKYMPKGGPDGGDGGKGGGVYFETNMNLHNLSHFSKNRIYQAGNGMHGMGANRTGHDGNDLVVKIPPGTQIINAESGDILVDLVDENTRYLAAEGGIGGKGNAFFKSSTFQTPRFAQPGIKTEEILITLNLKLIADIGLVGLPNSGKSTLLSILTNARPKIGNYPFTTLIPNLGIIEGRGGKPYRIADIPGIIEGAHKGHGLGLSFLQHIERVKVILYLIECTGDDLLYNLELLKSELGFYNGELLKKPGYIILTKSDLLDEEELNERILILEGNKLLAISAVDKKNITGLIEIIDDLMDG